ncbi:MAG TPA: hypothetical protein DCO72_00680 [Ruminococcus sp.]|nr:hypothetical protein [Ruminococcus sp.]
MKKKFLALLTGLSLLWSSVPFPVCADHHEIISSQYDNIFWTLENHVLTISGEGEIHSQKNALPDWLAYSDEIEEIIIEEGITSAQYRAFAELPNLESITFPATFEQLGTEALFNDRDLEEINGLEYVHYFDFRCLSNTEYTEKHPFIINDDILYYAEGTDLTVPDGVKVIAPFAFGNLTAYETTSKKAFTEIPYYDIVLPEGLETIQRYAFAFSSRLCHVNIPESVQTIGDYAFFSCPNLETVTLSENCTEIGNFAFFNCRLLENFNAENSSMNMGFRSCGYNADWDTILKDRATQKGIDLTLPKYANLLHQIENADTETLVNYDELADWTQLHYKTTQSFREIAEGEYTDELSDSVQKSSEIIIHGYIGSTVKQYADDNRLKFISSDDILIGDVTLDGKLNIIDVLTMNEWSMGLVEFSERQVLASDFDQNGIFTDNDTMKLLRHLVGLT